jgi:multidrug resistance protein, MATE family
MKKNIITSYIEGITNREHGESYTAILHYFIPEFITNLIVYSMPLWLDAIFIGALKSTPAYATLGVTNNIIHLGIKVAEALAVSTVVLSGQFNGQKEYKKVGDTMRDAFWVTCLLGMIFCLALFYGGEPIYRWYGVSPDVVALGLPYIRLRAIGVLFMFIYFAFVGFLRGVKNTRTPMKIFMFGAAIFVLADYGFIFGHFGLPAYGLQGSAIATVLQYTSMCAIALLYVLFNEKNRKYGVTLLSIFDSEHEIIRFLKISWPIIIDKAALAIAYVWLGMMIAPIGTNAIAAFSAIKDMERFAFLPAIAFAQVITLLVSNNMGARDMHAVKVNLKKVLLLGGFMVALILFFMTLYTKQVLSLFDKQGDFTALVVSVFPWISGFVIFDLLQLILSGALRGAGNIHTVMWVRFCIVFGFFMPISYIFAHIPFESPALKIILIYGSFYIGNGLMSIWYIKRFRGEKWKTLVI